MCSQIPMLGLSLGLAACSRGADPRLFLGVSARADSRDRQPCKLKGAFIDCGGFQMLADWEGTCEIYGTLSSR